MSLAQLPAGIWASPMVYRVGWALIHSLWLGAAVAAVLAAVLVMLRRRSANARYLAGCSALIATVVLVLGATAVVRPRVEQAGRQDSVHRDVRSSWNVKVDRAYGRVETSDGVPLPPKASAPAPAAGSEVVPIAGRAPEAWTARVSKALDPVLPWGVSAWSAGVCVLFVWHLAGWLAVGRLRRQAREPAEAGLVEVAARLARALRVSRPVRLLESAVVRVPTVAGWLRPAILLPVSLATGLPSEQIAAILAHELAHIRRWDYLVNLLQSLVETLLFYHPAVWWMSHRIRVERENACDDLAVAIGQERSTYAESLARTAEMACAAGQGAGVLGRVTVGAVRRPSGLRNRIFRLLDGDGGSRVRFPGSWPGALATAAVILCLAFLLIRAAAGPNAPEEAVKRPEVKWGQAASGLRCGLTADRAEVPMGSKVDFILHLQFDPETAEPKVGILNRTRPHVFKVGLTLTDTKTGKMLQRAAFDIGMMRPQVRVPLEDKPLEPENLEVYLLTDAGVQVPAGTYSVTATCDVDPSRVRVDPPPKAEVRAWAGRIVSGPVPLTVTPAEPKTVAVKVPTSVVFLSDNGRLVWDFSEKDMAAVSLRVRPGFNLAYRISWGLLLNNKPVMRSGGGGSGGYPEFLPPDRDNVPVSGALSNHVLAGAKLKVAADLEIIENSAPGRQGWSPVGPVIHKARIEGVATKSTLANLVRQPEKTWGTAVDGLQTRLVAPEGGATMFLENVELFLLVRNVSAAEIAVDGVGDIWQFVTVKKEGMTNVPGLKPSEPAAESIRLKPAESGEWAEVATTRLNRIVDLKPGTYTLQWRAPAGKASAPLRVPPPSNVLYLKVIRRPDGRLVVTELPAPVKAAITALDTKIVGTVGTPLKLALGGTGKTRIELEIDEVANSKPKQYVVQFTVVDTKPGGTEVFLPSPKLFIQEGIPSGLKVERENGNRMEIEMTVTEVPPPKHAVQTAKAEPPTGEAAATDEKAAKKPTQYVAKIKLLVAKQDGKAITALEIIENSAPGRQGWSPVGPVIHKARIEGVATKSTLANLVRQPEKTWGTAVDGLQTRLVAPEGGATMFLENVELFLLVRNVSAAEIAVDGVGDIWQFVTVKKEGMTNVPGLKPSEPAAESIRLKPAESGEWAEVATTRLNRIVDLKPGTYTLQWRAPAGKASAPLRVPPPSNVLYLKVIRRPDGRLVVTELPAPVKAAITAPGGAGSAMLDRNREKRRS